MSATGDHGFTLIEMLVVLAIAALLGGIAAPRLQATMQAAEARSATAAVAAGLRRTRARALLGATTARFEVLPDGRGFSIAGGPVAALPDSVRVAQDRIVAFYADGTSSGGQVEVRSERGATSFQIARATGLFGTAK